MHSLVRKHRLADDIADREDMRHIRPHLLIDGDEAAVTNRDARFFGLDRLAVRASANRDQYHVIDLRLRRRVRAFKTDGEDRKSTRLNSSHLGISYAVFCLKK